MGTVVTKHACQWKLHRTLAKRSKVRLREYGMTTAGHLHAVAKHTEPHYNCRTYKPNYVSAHPRPPESMLHFCSTFITLL